MAKAARCSSGSLMRLGAVRDVVLARVPLEAHRALGQTCKELRRLVYSDDFAKLRKALGLDEYGLLLLGGNEEGLYKIGSSLVCLTHNLKSLGFRAPETQHLELGDFTTALSTDGMLVICGDANPGERDVLVYDTREHALVEDLRFPDRLPLPMRGQCTAYVGDTLLAVAGGDRTDCETWAFSWDEESLWQELPPVPTGVFTPAYGVIGSRLFLVGGYTDDFAHAEHYGGIGMYDYTARLQIFDMTRRTWSLGPPLDALKDREEEPTTAAVHDGRLYVFCQRAMFEGSSNRIDNELRACSVHAYCFDPLSNSWSELPPLPVDALSEFVTCVHDGRLVVVGTMNVDPDVYDHDLDPPSTYHYEWDDGAEMWKERPLLIDDVDAWPQGWLGSLVSVPLRIR